MNNHSVTLLDIDKIGPTEETDFNHVNALANSIRVAGVWTHPILVDDIAYALMDGHHRFRAAQQIGLSTVPVALLNYEDDGVQLEARRQGEAITPERLRKIAGQGHLLPYKSTRHLIDMPLPRCSIPLNTLKNPKACGTVIDHMTPQPTRSQILTDFYRSFGRQVRIRTLAADCVDTETAESQAPHLRLRQALQADPAMAALLSGTSSRIALGDVEHTPFFLQKSGILLLPPTLIEDPSALAAAARWGLEAAHAAKVATLDGRWLTSILRHGAGLLAASSIASRNLLLNDLPDEIRREITNDGARRPSLALQAWQASLIEGAPVPERTSSCTDFQSPVLSGPIENRIEGIAVPGSSAQCSDYPELALEAPIEQLLVSGGDSRLGLDNRTGFNNYGVPPRPRPEAIQFSSSTASAISDYGFLFADVLRRDLLTRVLEGGANEGELHGRATDATGHALRSLFGLAEDTADVAITASGTDVELMTVMLSLAGAGKRNLTNVLIAPSETGRGVKSAGAGRYFDDLAATGAVIEKNAEIWPEAEIKVSEVAIRDDLGRPRMAEEMDREFLAVGQEALASGDHVLAHVLVSSKTGLSAPSPDAVEALVDLAPDRVDVVVDACQMRSEFHEIGAMVRRGWMVQVSGSKFLTGPPFSGALIAPAKLRTRAKSAAHLLAQAPGVGSRNNWSSAWADLLPQNEARREQSFGPMLRWLPALLEAELLRRLPNSMRRWAFQRFRKAVVSRLEQSQWLRPIDIGEMIDPGSAAADGISRHSIVSFQVLRKNQDGSSSPLGEASCRKIFELLNMDANDRLCLASAADKGLAAQPVHIGQPVTLASGANNTAILRMVLGARFFTIVGYAGAASIEAALDSEIADALRAVAKVELLASHWWQPREPESPIE